LKLGHLVHERIELREVARPFLRRLSDLAQTTANLAIFDAHELEVIFVEQVDSPAELQIRLRVGKRITPHATAVGKVLLAHLKSATLERVLKKHGMRRLTPHTIPDPKRLQAELQAVRRQGYAIDNEEAVLGAYCIAAPVRNHEGLVTAAVSISMMMIHSGRHGERRLAGLVTAAANDVSRALGYRESGLRGTREENRRAAV
jgi:DNA-binding IclR family transcriptional regulator